MKKNKIIILLVTICLCIGIGMRLYVVNTGLDDFPIIQVFNKGEVVPFGDDFWESSDQAINGYTMQIVGSEIVWMDEFFERYNTSGEFTVEDFDLYVVGFHLVTVSVSNIDYAGGEEGGIGLDHIFLTGTDYYTLVDDVAFEMVNPHMPGIGFALRQGTSMEIVIPYPIFEGTSKHSLHDDLKLVITEYPHQKSLRIT